MIQLFHAFIEEVAHRGVKGLAEMLDQRLGKAVDFFQGVREKYAKRKALRDQKAEAEKIAKMSAEQVVADIRAEVARAFPNLPKLRAEVELYLSLAPAAVQRTLRGKHDPKGYSAPPDYALDSPEKVAAMFPAAVPTLRPNNPVPGRESKYRLIAPVGGGGFGEVWKAADLMRPNHFVAVKVFPDPNTNLAMIRHEYKQAMRLNDPAKGWPAGVVPVVDAELDGEHPWIMYEFVGGGTLAELIAHMQTLDADERVPCALAVLKSLAGTCAHFHGLNPPLVHRDLKPANVLWDATANSMKITDLGLGGAAVEYGLATDRPSQRNYSGWLPTVLLGSYSPLYASPEQRDKCPPDPRDDVHALGVIGFQMLTGNLNAAPGPDAAEELAELGVPKPLARLVVACTAGSQARRPENAAAIVAEIARFKSPRKVPVLTAQSPELRRPDVEQAWEGLDEPETTDRSRVIGLTFIILAVMFVACIVVFVFSLGERREVTPEVVKPRTTTLDDSGNNPGQEVTLPLGTSGVNMTFCWCPPGVYQRGSTDGGDGVKPVREITISKGFWLAKYETTQSQWVALGFKNVSKFEGDTLPVENVSHAEAVEYAAKLKTVSGKSVRLPTEAEWEYACRAETPAGQRYWSGDTEADLARVGWFSGNSGGKTHTVGETNQPNPWGLHDMHGNVCEWCADHHGSYSAGETVDPVGPKSGLYRVFRGGCWYDHAESCRAASRFRFSPDSRNSVLGFRLAADPSGEGMGSQREANLKSGAKPGEPETAATGRPDRTRANLKSGAKPGEEVSLPLGDSGVNITFCWCPPGKFERGSNDGEDNEKPVREITISKGFWMAKYETTQAQWEALGFKNESNWKGDTLPVENVRHTEAVEYANKLKAVSGKSVRLPTEAEWEYACRAGTPAGQKYWSGNTEEDLKRVGWFNGNSGSKTHPVGEKNKPNPWGLHDMHGNVWEWCADWYDAGFYAKSSKEDPTGPESGSERVIRGGGWRGSAKLCGATIRYGYWSGGQQGYLGFRLAAGPSGK